MTSDHREGFFVKDAKLLLEMIWAFLFLKMYKFKKKNTQKLKKVEVFYF